MSESRFATAEDLAVVRERLARVEGGHDHLSAQMTALSDRIDSTRDSLTERIDRTAADTRTEITRHVDGALRDQGAQIQTVSNVVAGMAGNIRFMKWSLLFGVTLITGLLGWGQIGDWAWGEVRIWYSGGQAHIVLPHSTPGIPSELPVSNSNKG